ncbi:MAG TPA: dihydropteroate synthase [Nitrospiraceae bacterium]|nr:dihydropteroate synthase [Nitrospiraceae bacterium]
MILRAKDRTIGVSDRPLVMGVVNVTPDSFFDGGKYATTDAVVRHALQLTEEGADLLDIGGESTRPGSDSIEAGEELRRLLPVVTAVAKAVTIPISVDTKKSTVARAALEAGAVIINDVTALQADAAMADLVAATGAGVVLMHMRGMPKTMQEAPSYDDVVGEVTEFFRERVKFCRERGIGQDQIVLDPGIGFGKLLVHNLTLLGQLESFAQFGRPILVGVSMKAFIGQVLGRPLEERSWGTAAAIALAVSKGAGILRVHNVRGMKEVVAMAAAITRYANASARVQHA